MLIMWEGPVGYARKRRSTDGRIRYQAIFRDLRGDELSAGTFDSKTKADKAWQRMEARVAEGRAGDPRRGRQTFQRYVEDEWLPNHVMEINTREGYTYSIYKYIIPVFGHM